MSLQLRLLASIAAALVLALLLGGVVLCWQARAAVRDEIHTAFQGAREVVRDTLKGDVRHTVTMRRIIASFDGQHHVRAALLNEAGRMVASSQTAPPVSTAPGWFAALVAPPPLTVRIPIALPHYPCILLLASDARDETGEVWAYARDAFAVMALFCAATLLFAWLVIGRSLRFFRHLQTGLRTVSNGDYEARLTPAGPPEFAALARGFNHMTERLSLYRGSNQRLQQQLLTLQDEERAEIARDLHDEVGPYLFAIQVDADAVAKGGDAAARERAGAIKGAALHIQRHVKAILRQLRPVDSLDFGLETAIGDIVSFWQRRHPEIRFTREIASDLGLDRRGEAAAYRIVQESVSNAVRHGHPRTIGIRLLRDVQGVTVDIEDDGDGLRPGPPQSGMGLTGMAERVRMLNGRLTVARRPQHGVLVSAFLPGAWQKEPA